MNHDKFFTSKAAGVFFNAIICLILLLFFAGYFIDLSAELLSVITVLMVVSIAIFVLRFKQLLLYALAFFIPVSIPLQVFGGSVISVPSEMICVLFTGFFFIKIIIGKKIDPKFLVHPVTILVLCDLAWLFITSVSSQMPEASFKRFFIRLCYYITFYYFYYELFQLNKGSIKKVLTLHAIGFLIPIIYATFRHAGMGFVTVGSQRISAPFYFDHTIYGACLVFFIPCLFFYASKGNPMKERIYYGVVLGFFLIATLLSYSRAAWLSLLIAGVVNLIIRYQIKVKYLAVGFIIILLALVFNWQKIIVNLKENKETSHSNNLGMHLKSISNVNTDASNKERINRWKCALRMFADKPLLGFGPGTYQFFYGQYQQREETTNISTYKGVGGHAHSEYLNSLSETGLPGLTIFIALISTACIKCLGIYKSDKEVMNRNIALYVFTGLVTFLVHGFFNGFLEFDKMAMPVFCSFAIIVSINIGNTKNIKL